MILTIPSPTVSLLSFHSFIMEPIFHQHKCIQISKRMGNQSVIVYSKWIVIIALFFSFFLEYCDVQRTLAGEEVRILKRRACCCALWGSRAAYSLSLSYPRLTSNPISVPRVLLIARCKLFYFYQCAICEINLIPKSKGLRCNVKT